jgi:hypothetical protein
MEMVAMNVTRRLNWFSASTVRPLVAVMMAGNLAAGWAASPAIGMAVASGAFELDASRVTGNGTLFDGSTIETGKATSQLRLDSGVRLMLDTGTRSKIYRDRMLLERGTGQIERSGSYRILARSLQIQSTEAGMAKVSLRDGNRVHVAALNGPVSVKTASGLLVAKVAPGNAVEMEPQEAGAAAPATITGCLQKKNGHYMITDETAGITVEVQGSNLEKEVGNRIEITGVLDPSASPAMGASQVVRASQINHISKKCSAAAGAVIPATAGGSGAGKAVIAGVIIAGAATGTAVGLTRDDKTSISQ